MCDDALTEPREAFSIEVVVDTCPVGSKHEMGTNGCRGVTEPGTTLQRGTSISRSFLINDDDSFLAPPRNPVLVAEGQDMRFSLGRAGG